MTRVFLVTVVVAAMLIWVLLMVLPLVTRWLTSLIAQRRRRRAQVAAARPPPAPTQGILLTGSTGLLNALAIDHLAEERPARPSTPPPSPPAPPIDPLARARADLDRAQADLVAARVSAARARRAVGPASHQTTVRRGAHYMELAAHPSRARRRHRGGLALYHARGLQTGRQHRDRVRA